MMNEELIKELRSVVTQRIDMSRDTSDEEIYQSIEDTVREKTKESYISLSDKSVIIETIFNAMRRLDVLQPLIDDKNISEIMVNGADDIFIERSGRVEKLPVRFESTEKLENVIQNIVAKVNRTVNTSSPIVDARLKDGSRVNIVLPPIALNGPVITIRKFPDKPITIEQLIEYGSITREIADVLKSAVAAKFNIFISGGTGSGKTTFLNALSNFIPSDERVITIEDSAELQIIGVDNLIRMETRNANVEGRGAITMKELIKASLRMRPERIVVGEVRGAEALDMLQAMNTGHDGSLSTGHANSTRDMLSRLETMVLTGTSMPLDAIRQQIASALDIIIHLSRLRDRSRRVLEICEVLDYKDGAIQINPLYVFKENEKSTKDKVFGSLVRMANPLVNTNKLLAAGLDEVF